MRRLLTAIQHFFNNIFHGLEGLIQEYIDPAIEVVEAIKKVADGTAISFVVALTPTGVDDKLLTLLKQYLPHILEALVLVKDAQGKTLDEIIALASVELNAITDKDARNLKLNNIAAYLTKAMSDGHLSLGEAIGGVQMVFDAKFNKAA